nr:MAG TPA: hypothetical protein [Caudoviricetes sp.]
MPSQTAPASTGSVPCALCSPRKLTTPTRWRATLPRSHADSRMSTRKSRNLNS